MKLTLNLAALSAMNVLLAFFYQWFTLTQLGPGRATDALFAGMVVPQLVLAVVSGSLTHVLVPLLTGQRDEAFARNAWTCFLGVGALFGGLAVVLFVGAPGWVPLTVPGFDSEARELTVELVRIQLLGMVFTAMTGVLWSAFQARQRFLWVESSPIIAFLIGFPILLLGLPRFGVAAAAWALVAKAVVQWLFLLPVIGRYRKPDFRSDFANAAWRRVRPLLIGSSYARTEQLVDRALASLAAPGALSLFFLAQQLYGAGHQVLNSAVSAPLVPRLSQRFAAGDETGFAQLRRSRLQGIAAFTVAVFLAVVLAGQPVLELLFGHGRFSFDQIRELWWLMLALGGTWVGGAVGQILASSFYARGNTTTPTRIGVFGFTVGLLLKVVGFFWLGIVGVALASTAYYLLNAALLAYFHRRSTRTEPFIRGEAVAEQTTYEPSGRS